MENGLMVSQKIKLSFTKQSGNSIPRCRPKKTESRDSKFSQCYSQEPKGRNSNPNVHLQVNG